MSLAVQGVVSANASQLNNITIDAGSRNEIQQALTQGLEVTVHESPITINGWTGSGYAILDADYGAGAYKISGGASGGQIVLDVLGALFGLLQSLTDFFTALNFSLDGPFSSFLRALGNSLTIVNFSIGFLNLFADERCSGASLIYMLVVYSVVSIAVVALAAALSAIVVGAFYVLTLLSLVNFAINKMISNLSNVVCKN